MAGEDTAPQRAVNDERAWRAIAHPVRLELLHEMTRFDRVRAKDLATAIGEPANSVSFHLRQLARYGLIEQAPSEGDRREKWWRLTHRDGMRIDLDEATPRTRRAARQAFAIEQAHAHELLDTWFAAALGEEPSEGQQPEANSDFTNFELYFDLPPEQWHELKQELRALLLRWRDRGAPGPGRQTYTLLGFGASRQDLEDARRRRTT